MNNLIHTTRHMARTACKWFIIGALDGETVRAYAVELNAETLAFLFSDKPQSGKDGLNIKYRSTKAKREMLNRSAEWMLEFKADRLENFDRVRINRKGKPYKLNDGEVFELIIEEMTGGRLASKRNLCHTDGGDIQISGIQYQLKYERATIVIG